jgi:hypothetical protein
VEGNVKEGVLVVAGEVGGASMGLGNPIVATIPFMEEKRRMSMRSFMMVRGITRVVKLSELVCIICEKHLYIMVVELTVKIR